MGKKQLLGLSPKEYEHPFDREALIRLEKIPGLRTVTNAFLNWTYVKWHIIELQGSNFKITEESCPELYKLVKEVEATLDVADSPEVYTQWGYSINGNTTGTKGDTLMVLNSGAVDLLSDDQLKYVIGHEMGHIKSNHVLYHMMAQFFPILASMVPVVGAFVGTSLELVLMYWARMSEFTADRAGLLACQDKEAALSAIVKMAGLPLKYYEKANENAFLKQAEDFERMHKDFLSGTMQHLSILTSTHPWTVYRAAELVKWINSGEYDRILSQTSSNTKRCCVCGHVVPIEVSVCPYDGCDEFEPIV